jgi:hypothetical protein
VSSPQPFTAERLSTVVPVDDLAAAVEQWTALLGVAPTFVDGDRWAQFDVGGGGRLSLAGTDRAANTPGLMIKVADIEAAREQLIALGLAPGEIEQGPHEARIGVSGPGGLPITVYGAPKS